MKKISLLILGALTSLTCMSALAQPLKASEGFGITNYTDGTWTDISTDQCEGVSTPLTIKNQTGLTDNPIVFDDSTYNYGTRCNMTYVTYDDNADRYSVVVTVWKDAITGDFKSASSDEYLATPEAYGADLHNWMM